MVIALQPIIMLRSILSLPIGPGPDLDPETIIGAGTIIGNDLLILHTNSVVKYGSPLYIKSKPRVR